MPHYTDNVLYKTHQHYLVLVMKFISRFMSWSVWVFVVGKYVLEWGLFPQIFLILWGWAVIFGRYYFFWVKSYFIISNEKIIVKVRNGLFSKFHMSIHYKNIRDTAFSKNNILHYAFNYGTLFARSSAGAVGDLEARSIPDIEKVYKIVNYLHQLSTEERKDLEHIDGIITNMVSGRDIEASSKTIPQSKKSGWEKETPKQAIQKETQILLNIQWIKEVVVLSDADRRYIFENEEDRNHGVYESLRKQVLLAVTHDSTFRTPDEAIVMKAGEKVVFPTVKFHEINRPSVISSSPGTKVHEYLIPKFQKLWEYDATLIIGFDI